MADTRVTTVAWSAACYQLGNLHRPARFLDGRRVDATRSDGPKDRAVRSTCRSNRSSGRLSDRRFGAAGAHHHHDHHDQEDHHHGHQNEVTIMTTSHHHHGRGPGDQRTQASVSANFRPRGNGGDPLFALLQLTNASFPTGAFTHSFGFETWIHDRCRRRRARGRNVDAVLGCAIGIATCDAVAVCQAYRAALNGDAERLASLDRSLGALKLARETRDASIMTGKALLAACRDISSSRACGITG